MDSRTFIMDSVMRLTIALLAGLIMTPFAVCADTVETSIAAYENSVRKAYARETKSQCLIRMRATSDEIIVCGEVERRDRYRMTKGGYVLPDAAVLQSPAEKFLETKAMVAAAQGAVGAGYTSFLSGIKRGYLRGNYKLVSQLFAGEDPDADDE
jgi:hypothetical protein